MTLTKIAVEKEFLSAMKEKRLKRGKNSHNKASLESSVMINTFYVNLCL